VIVLLEYKRIEVNSDYLKILKTAMEVSKHTLGTELGNIIYNVESSLQGIRKPESFNSERIQKLKFQIN
jgi:hypothetical protein